MKKIQATAEKAALLHRMGAAEFVDSAGILVWRGAERKGISRRRAGVVIPVAGQS